MSEGDFIDNREQLERKIIYFHQILDLTSVCVVIKQTSTKNCNRNDVINHSIIMIIFINFYWNWKTIRKYKSFNNLIKDETQFGNIVYFITGLGFIWKVLLSASRSKENLLANIFFNVCGFSLLRYSKLQHCVQPPEVLPSHLMRHGTYLINTLARLTYTVSVVSTLGCTKLISCTNPGLGWHILLF